MKLTIKAIIIIWLCALSSIHAASGNPLPSGYDHGRDPEKDLATAATIAKESGKNILLKIGGDWCSWCNTLDTWIEENPEVKNYLQTHYVVLKIYYGDLNRNIKFLSSYPKREGIPFFYVLSPEGELIHSQETGSLEKGESYDKEKFLTFLKKWIKK